MQMQSVVGRSQRAACSEISANNARTFLPRATEALISRRDLHSRPIPIAISPVLLAFKARRSRSSSLPRDERAAEALTTVETRYVSRAIESQKTAAQQVARVNYYRHTPWLPRYVSACRDFQGQVSATRVVEECGRRRPCVAHAEACSVVGICR